MPTPPSPPSHQFTFRGNILSGTRHGWLRLTPAYSVELVRDLLSDATTRHPVLDPFCGTGTTALACVERGLDATTLELNPFLAWLTRTKTRSYSGRVVGRARELVEHMAAAAAARSPRHPEVPAIHRVQRWWSGGALAGLGRARAVLSASRASESARDLGRLAFCRALIEVANVSFAHQSMSFMADPPPRSGRDVAGALLGAMDDLARTARRRPGTGQAEVVVGDSRNVGGLVGSTRFGCVVTSPPYPNRMSYVRELRPYMYWLDYLTDRSDAGELDWAAIGGTWGAATSRLSAWAPSPSKPIAFDGFQGLVDRIGRHSPVLGRYVERYFEDMTDHVQGLAPALAPGAKVHYVVGNAKFFDVVVPVHEIFVALFESAGLEGGHVQMLRKRTSKRELFEYLVTAEKPLMSVNGSQRRKGAPRV